MKKGDIILVSLREFQDGKGDVILRYTPDEARQLKSYGELPESAKINENVVEGEGEGDDEEAFEFDEEAIEIDDL